MLSFIQFGLSKYNPGEIFDPFYQNIICSIKCTCFDSNLSLKYVSHSYKNDAFWLKSVISIVRKLCQNE